MLQVRKPSRERDAPEDTVTCCLCQMPGPAFDLSCSACQAMLPFCIVTGKRMQLGDWTQCPHCHFNASSSEMQAHASDTHKCPLCEGAIDEGSLSVIQGLPAELQPQ